MPVRHVVIMSSGGLKSLVATALTASSGEKLRITLFHVLDGRENTATRLEYVRRQAEFLSIYHVNEIKMPHVFGHGFGKSPTGEPVGMLASAQMILAALAHARFSQAEKVIWPAAFDGDPKSIAKATEQVLLCEHLAHIENSTIPALTSPLIEMTDQQIIELGGQLQVPWRLAWSCTNQTKSPCRTCPACRRRKNAFEKAGVLDPVEKLIPA